MKRTIVILSLSGLLFTVGCSRPTADAPAGATPIPQTSAEPEKEQTVKAKAVEAHVMKAEPANDKPITAGSPSPSASNPSP
jgi:hypothetical protein